MKTLISTIFVAAVFAIVSLPSLSAQDINFVLSRMDKSKRELTSLKADIKMTEYDATLADDTVKKGRVQYKPKKGRDAFFRIDWETPDEALIVAAGRYIIWRKRHKTATVGKVDKSAKQKGTKSALKFLSMSKSELIKNYKIV